MKKFAVLGRGTAGALTAAMANYLLVRRKKFNCEIEWIFDPETPTQAVGEGTTLNVCTTLRNCLDFRHHDLHKIDGNFKTGILKNGWGTANEEFVHNFLPPITSYHFNAIKLQNYIFEELRKSSNIKIVEEKITSDKIDADYIVDCSGKPKEIDDRFVVPSEIPVNAVYVTQCFWDHPKFAYSLTNAAKHGWYFGIPLQNRCSIGYLYNKDLNTIDEIKEDVQQVFEKYNLVPSDVTNAFHFKNYYRKKTFTERISYNGNCSFFIEPLEATTLSTVDIVAQSSINSFINTTINKLNKETFYTKFNTSITNEIESIIDMIMLHYMAGSKYKSKFWDYASENGETRIKNSLKNKIKFQKILKHNFSPNFNYYDSFKLDNLNYGSWSSFSWHDNITGLGLNDRIRSML